MLASTRAASEEEHSSSFIFLFLRSFKGSWLWSSIELSGVGRCGVREGRCGVREGWCGEKERVTWWVEGGQRQKGEG